jgi:hypothetical protein
MGRRRFFFNLGVLGASILLIVAAGAFSPAAARGVGLGIGSACFAFSLWFVGSLIHRSHFDGNLEFRLRRLRVHVWPLMGWTIAGVAVWEIIQAAVFGVHVSKWLTLANGLVILVLGCIGLVTHEVTTDRVVWLLEVVERPDRDS